MNKKDIFEAIDNYNKYKSTEAIASLHHLGEKSFIIKFQGHFTNTCCINDYFDDFLEELEFKAKIDTIKKIKNHYFVKFKIKN